MMSSKDMALLAVQALDAKKGQDIRLLNTAELTSLADHFVICTATSSTHIKTLSDAAEKALKDAGEDPHHVEGHRGGSWVLLDFGCLVIHLFTEETREFYNLERLWSDAREEDLAGMLQKD